MHRTTAEWARLYWSGCVMLRRGVERQVQLGRQALASIIRDAPTSSKIYDLAGKALVEHEGHKTI